MRTFLLVLLTALLSLRPVSSPAARPNILLIVADDLGFSDLGCYGGEIRTPHLDSLAANGLRLTQFYNIGRCCSSRAAILTGQYPHRVGLGHMTQDIGQPGYRGRVSEQAATIAEVLGGAGYRSFISGKWHLGTEDPTRHGFEEFFGTLTSAKTFWDAGQYLRLPAGRPVRQYAPGGFYGTDALTDYALDFLNLARRTPERPWFLYLAYNAPHFPLHACAEDIARYRDVYARGWDAIRGERLARMKQLGLVAPSTRLTPRSPWWNYGETETGVNPAWDSLPPDRRADLARRMAVYAAMVDRMDQNIGRLVADLRARGELDHTLILFLSDNGACAEWDPRGFDVTSGNQNMLHANDALERMGGPGTYHSAGSGWANAANTPWRLYKHFNHEGGISTPLVVHWPAGLKGAGRMDSTPAHIIDLLPTIVAVAGAEYPKVIGDRQIIPPAGASLLPLLRGGAMPGRTLFFEHEGHRAVREGDWKLTAISGGPWELYDLSRDRTELNDLAGRFPERVRDLAARWDAWAAANQVTPWPENYGVAYLRERQPVKR